MMMAYDIAVLLSDGIGPEVIAGGGGQTPDIGGPAKTAEVGRAVADRIG